MHTCVRTCVCIQPSHSPGHRSAGDRGAGAGHSVLVTPEGLAVASHTRSDGTTTVPTVLLSGWGPGSEGPAGRLPDHGLPRGSAPRAGRPHSLLGARSLPARLGTRLRSPLPRLRVGAPGGLSPRGQARHARHVGTDTQRTRAMAGAPLSAQQGNFQGLPPSALARAPQGAKSPGLDASHRSCLRHRGAWAQPETGRSTPAREDSGRDGTGARRSLIPSQKLLGSLRD